jgi:hypothetical protein
MDCSLLYITYVIQTIISPCLPRIGHSDAPAPPVCDGLDACHSSYLSATYNTIKMSEFIGNNTISTISIPYVPDVMYLT